MNANGNVNANSENSRRVPEHLNPVEVPIVHDQISAGDRSLHAMYAQLLRLMQKAEETRAAQAKQAAVGAAMAEMVDLDAYRRGREVAQSQSRPADMAEELASDAITRAREAVNMAHGLREGTTDVQEAA